MNSMRWMMWAVVLMAPVSWAEEAGKAAAAPAAADASAAAGVKVEKVGVGTAIDNKELSGEADKFSDSVPRLYCWTKVSVENPPAALKHVWSADGKVEAEVSLEAKYESTRTWSSKNVWPGAWKVDVVDDKGTVLASKEFTVTKEAPAATPQ